jgi:D-aminopeptidase
MSTGSRARDIGIPFDGQPGTANAITDVGDVWVGHCAPDGLMTGVTAILPRGNHLKQKPATNTDYGVAGDDKLGIDTSVFAAWFTLNGNGEMTGTTCIEELGYLEGPIVLTNTVAVGTVRNAVLNIAYQQQQQPDPDKFTLMLPVVAETYDGWLNEILDTSKQVTPQMVLCAINSAKQYASKDTVDEGNVGGGKSMTCYSWKGGIGTASRAQITLFNPDTGDKLPDPYTVGVLVQANQGTYWDLVVRGVPVGTKMTPPDSPDSPPPITNGPNPQPAGAPSSKSRTASDRRGGKNSIIVVIATDAPLMPSQLKRLARRASLGVGRTGTITNDDSGEIFIAFSTANTKAVSDDSVNKLCAVPNECMDQLFEATVNATEEAIINALVAAKTLEGRKQRTAWGIMDEGLPSTLIDVMKSFQLFPPAPPR